MKKYTMLPLIFCVICVILNQTAYAEWDYDAKELCYYIYIIEGKEDARQAFGIETIQCNSFKECEQICINTIENNKVRYLKQTEEKSFLTFLAKRYCPPNWEIWLKNLKWYLNKGK